MASKRQTAEKQRKYFQTILKSACEKIRLDDLGCRYNTSLNKDLSVDGDIVIEPVDNVGLALLSIKDAGDWEKIPDSWITIALKRSIPKSGQSVRGSPPIDRGTYSNWTYPYHSSNARFTFETARDIYSRMVDAFGVDGANITTIIIRLHWNWQDKQPGRPRYDE